MATSKGALATAPNLDDIPPAKPSDNDWPWWRGTNCNSIAPDNHEPPTHWSATENIVWKTDVLGRGHGTPSIWGDRIFVATADDKAQVQYILCFDRTTGKKLWETKIHEGGFTRQNPKNSQATATPACDGEYVFAAFANQSAVWLTALDFSGKIIWQKRLGDYEASHGFAPSPAIYKSLVIVSGDSVKGSFLAAAHRRSGETIWKITRPDILMNGNYATPIVGRVAGRDQLLINGPQKVYSYDPATGALIWICDGPCDMSPSTMVFGDTMVYAAGGYPQKNLIAIRADGQGDVSQTHIVWRKDQKTGIAYVPTPLLADGLYCMVDDTGKASCLDAKTGEDIWQQKLEGAFSSSPVLAGGNIYIVNEKGMTTVMKQGRKFEIIAQNDLADGGFATPVILGNRIYLRTLHALYCIGK